jgi:hypothetical protein
MPWSQAMQAQHQAPFSTLWAKPLDTQQDEFRLEVSPLKRISIAIHGSSLIG